MLIIPPSPPQKIKDLNQGLMLGTEYNNQSCLHGDVINIGRSFACNITVHVLGGKNSLCNINLKKFLYFYNL